jgi:hypothetical protein
MLDTREYLAVTETLPGKPVFLKKRNPLTVHKVTVRLELVVIIPSSPSLL